MSGFAQPIYIPIARVPTLRAAVVILHLIVVIVPPLVSAWSPQTALVMICALVSLWLASRDHRAVDGDLRSVLLRPNGQWIVSTRSNEQIPAELARSPFVSMPVIVVTLAADSGRRWHLVFTRYNTAADSLRRLRVRLNAAAAEDSERT